MDFNWINHPAMKNIDARKLAVLVEIANEAEGKTTPDKILPLLVKTNAKIKSLGLDFSKDETDLIIEILTRDMSPADKQKVEMIKKMTTRKK